MITIGTQFYPAAADSAARQQRCLAALLTLRGVHPVNLQFVDDPFRPDGIETRAVLRQDSRPRGKGRKPIVSEMFDALASAAAANGDRYFAYLNADIEVTDTAVAHVIDGKREAYAFCRIDLDPGTRRPLAVMLRGLDMFAVEVNFWERERRRFRPYIAGEPVWDTVYAAVMASHGRTRIVDVDSGILHEQHPGNWGAGAGAEYNGYLAALDAPYFSRWTHYHAALERARAANEPLDRDQLMEKIFSGPVVPAAAYPLHLARQLKARAKYSFRGLLGG